MRQPFGRRLIGLRFYLQGTLGYNDGFPRRDRHCIENMVLMVWLESDYLATEVTIWTIRLSMICLAGALTLRLQAPRPCTSTIENGDRHSVWMLGAKNLWLLGGFFSLLHAMAAMAFYHQWNHSLALADTARQTKSLLGFPVGIGLYFNYAFVSIWLADALWWIAASGSYEKRARWINGLVYGFLIFIAINGTVVFASGIVRWIASVALMGLAALAYQKFFRSKDSTANVESES